MERRIRTPLLRLLLRHPPRLLGERSLQSLVRLARLRGALGPVVEEVDERDQHPGAASARLRAERAAVHHAQRPQDVRLGSTRARVRVPSRVRPERRGEIGRAIHRVVVLQGSDVLGAPERGGAGGGGEHRAVRAPDGDARVVRAVPALVQHAKELERESDVVRVVVAVLEDAHRLPPRHRDEHLARGDARGHQPAPARRLAEVELRRARGEPRGEERARVVQGDRVALGARRERRAAGGDRRARPGGRPARREMTTPRRIIRRRPRRRRATETRGGGARGRPRRTAAPRGGERRGGRAASRRTGASMPETRRSRRADACGRPKRAVGDGGGAFYLDNKRNAPRGACGANWRCLPRCRTPGADGTGAARRFATPPSRPGGAFIGIFRP